MAWNLNDYEDVASLNRWFQDNFPAGRIDLIIEHADYANQEIVIACALYRDAMDSDPAITNLARGKASEYPKNMARWYVEDTATSAIGRSILLLKGAQKTATQDSMTQVKHSEEQLRRKEHFEAGGTIANYDKSHYRVTEGGGHKVEHPWKPEEAKDVANEPQTVVWDDFETKAFEDEGTFIQDLQKNLGATVEGFKCAHGEMLRKEGTSKAGKPYMGYVCGARSKADQCEAKWAKIVGGKWVFEGKATD
jgi:hypothetical protein